MVHCGDDIAAQCGASRSCDFMSRGSIVARAGPPRTLPLAPIDRHTARSGRTHQRASQSHGAAIWPLSVLACFRPQCRLAVPLRCSILTSASASDGSDLTHHRADNWHLSVMRTPGCAPAFLQRNGAAPCRSSDAASSTKRPSKSA